VLINNIKDIDNNKILIIKNGIKGSNSETWNIRWCLGKGDLLMSIL